MPYATVADVQARIPTQICTIGPASQPKQSDVESWLAADSAWVDATLRWKYLTPITHADDLVLLKPIVADLVASRVWSVIGGHKAEQLAMSQELRRQALQMLSFDRSSSQSRLVLPSSALADSGEAAVGQSDASFSDPDAEDGEPRLFSIDMDF